MVDDPELKALADVPRVRVISSINCVQYPQLTHHITDERMVRVCSVTFLIYILYKACQDGTFANNARNAVERSRFIPHIPHSS
jgi:hypothetical protein